MTKRTAYIQSELLEIERRLWKRNITERQAKERLTKLWNYCKADEQKDYKNDFFHIVESFNIAL